MKKYMRRHLLTCLASAALIASPTSHAEKNVLLIMVDDFNHWFGKNGYDKQAKTPNLNALAKKGVTFADTSSASPVCNPSRQALWSGLLPTTTGISSNSHPYIRDAAGFKNVVTMNQHFKKQGYHVYGGGKLYHPGSMGGHDTDPNNWSALYTGGSGAAKGTANDYTYVVDNNKKFAWSESTKPIDNNGDTKLANHFAQQIKNYNKNKPFFMAVGFFRPHLPWYAPKQFFDLYNESTISLPKGYKANDLNDVKNGKVDPLHTKVENAGKWKEAIRAYLANMSYADYNVGIVLDALNGSAHKNNTIVVFVGDHGWHLGEKSRWSKHAVYDQASRTTMIIADPDARGNGKVSKKVVSMLDIYPTLVSLTGINKQNKNEGNDLTRLLKNPNAAVWDAPILMTYNGTNIIKTNAWRLIDKGSNSQLYDMVNDPYELKNLYSDSNYSGTVKELRNQIKALSQ